MCSVVNELCRWFNQVHVEKYLRRHEMVPHFMARMRGKLRYGSLINFLCWLQMWKTAHIPLGSQLSKPEAQGLLHAVEELYFFRRFSEGARLARSLMDDDVGEDKLDKDLLKMLLYYEGKCRDKVQSGGMEYRELKP